MSAHFITLERIAREHSTFRGRTAVEAGIPWTSLGRGDREVALTNAVAMPPRRRSRVEIDIGDLAAAVVTVH